MAFSSSSLEFLSTQALVLLLHKVHLHQATVPCHGGVKWQRFEKAKQKWEVTIIKGEITFFFSLLRPRYLKMGVSDVITFFANCPPVSCVGFSLLVFGPFSKKVHFCKCKISIFSEKCCRWTHLLFYATVRIFKS